MKDNGIPPDALDSGKSKVLVVDDDPEIVELFVSATAASRSRPPPPATTPA
jgi:hypothetical protein